MVNIKCSEYYLVLSEVSSVYIGRKDIIEVDKTVDDCNRLINSRQVWKAVDKTVLKKIMDTQNRTLCIQKILQGIYDYKAAIQAVIVAMKVLSSNSW